MLEEKDLDKILKPIRKSLEEIEKLLLVSLFGQYPDQFETDKLGIKLPKNNRKNYIG